MNDLPLPLSLLVTVTDQSTGETESFAFDSSPVRFGRNPLNEMCVSNNTVSQWHGILRFNERSISYVDLGSTNGTGMNGHRLPRNESVSLNPGDVLQTSRMRIKVTRARLPRESISDKECTFFAESEERDRTMMLEKGAAKALASISNKAEPDTVNKVTLQCRVAYEKFQTAMSDAVEHLEICLQHLPSADRAPVLVALKDRLPELAETSAYRKLGAKHGIHPEQLGHVDMEDWLGRLLHGLEGAAAIKGKVDVHEVMPRLGAMLETFAQAYLDLHNGYQQFLAGMGLRLNTDTTGRLGQSKTARDALAYLLEGDAKHRMRELHRAFADMGLHQVALLNGVVEGVRGLLGEMKPETIAGLADAGAESPALRRGEGAGLFGSRLKHWWRAFADKYEELTVEERFSKKMFGRAFSRAYLTIMGNTDDRTSAEPNAKIPEGLRTLPVGASSARLGI